MINIQDLKIGNILQRIDVQGKMSPCVVMQIGKKSFGVLQDGLNYGILDLKECSSIPLTDTILKDSGFELTRDSMLTFRKDDFSVKLVFDSENCYVQFWHKSDWHDHKLIPCHSTEFVHDLQNAYYQATGENLKIVIK